MRHGFSLVELSIVLVILGLLVGGILVGQSLIHASELRAVNAEADRYRTATHAFRDKYLALPGDLTTATSFWGKNNTYCSSDAGTATTNGTCNGNGNGTITSPTGAVVQSAETFQFWHQLELAGLIEGTYTGISGTGGGGHGTIGVNSPASKYPRGGWSSLTRTNASTMFFAASGTSNSFQFGTDASSGTIYNKILKAEDAWNIDTKTDDGSPANGRVHAIWWDDCTNAANNADANATYLLDDTSIQCALIFVRVY